MSITAVLSKATSSALRVQTNAKDRENHIRILKPKKAYTDLGEEGDKKALVYAHDYRIVAVRKSL